MSGSSRECRRPAIRLRLPDLDPLTGPITVQMVKSSGGACWSATYGAPFSKDDGVSLSDRADN